MLALLAAACYGISAPVSKILLNGIPPALLASLLYLGAGFGMGIVLSLRSLRATPRAEARIKRKELPYVIGMVVLDIAAPILLMFGLSWTNPASVSLLNNFEIVATALIAMLVFKEAVGKRMWLAIVVITLACLVLSMEDIAHFTFSAGSLLVLLASVCWGLENNCTRMLSSKDPLQIVVIKGFGAGIGALLIALMAGETSASFLYILLALLLGFFAYGLSIALYIRAQRDLGAARTSAYYAIAPFIGMGFSLVVFGQPLNLSFVLGLVLMLAGAYLAAFEQHSHPHKHERVEHEHRHSHQDGHHHHAHPDNTVTHSHAHVHEVLEHAHPHTPDIHHQHPHP